MSGLISSISTSAVYGMFASASSTFMWPGIRPATGWIANLTVTPRLVSWSYSSRTLCWAWATAIPYPGMRSEEHTSELQSHSDLVCRLLLEKKKAVSHELSYHRSPELRHRG